MPSVPPPPPYTTTLSTRSYDLPPTPGLTPSLSHSTTYSTLTPSGVAPPVFPTPPNLSPTTSLPSTFRIGAHDVPALTSVPLLLAHLKFLAALAKLQDEVRATGEREIGDANVRWAVFCLRAEKNFESWVKAKLSRGYFPVERDLPGLDVLMVWHSYMLNPRWYFEDTTRCMPQLSALGKFPLEQIATQIDPQTLIYTPPPNTPPPPYPTIPTLHCHMFPCPSCTRALSVPFIVSPTDRSGFAQEHFKTSCPSCRLEINHDVLRMAKFAEDIAKVSRNEMAFLPGLGLTPSTGALSPTRVILSQVIADIFNSDNPPAPRTAKQIGDLVKWDINLAHTLIKTGGTAGYFVRPRPGSALALAAEQGAGKTRVVPSFAALGMRFEDLGKRVTRMHTAYSHSSMASLALGPAVGRQAGFIRKMREMGWLEPGRWERSVFLLQRSAARYHAFLDLMSAVPGGFLVPTLDIDLAWHTAQCDPVKYKADTEKYIHRFVDHDDKVSEGKLGDAYDLTSRAWVARFGVPYSTCGCHQHENPLKEGVGAKVKGLFGGGKESKSDKRRRLIEEMIDGMEQGEKDASHPSVHNMVAVVGLPQTESQRQARYARQLRLDKEAEEKAVKAQKKKDDKALTELALHKRPGHDDPFIYNIDGLGVGGKPIKRGTAADRERRNRDIYDPYWGVSPGYAYMGMYPMGMGYGYVGWGLADPDPNCMNGQSMATGACAAGVGMAGGSYCGGGGVGACSSMNTSQSACTSSGACGGGGSCGGGGGGCGGGGGGGGCGGGGGGCGGGGS